MTVGPLVAATGMLLLSRITAGSTYAADVLPGIAVFGLGMAITVAPLTAAVLASVGDDLTGLASGVNNAVARTAGLLAVAALPGLAGITGGATIGAGLDDGYAVALRICAAVTACGAVVAALLIRSTARVRTTTQPAIYQSCNDPAVGSRASSAA